MGKAFLTWELGLTKFSANNWPVNFTHLGAGEEGPLSLSSEAGEGGDFPRRFLGLRHKKYICQKRPNYYRNVSSKCSFVFIVCVLFSKLFFLFSLLLSSLLTMWKEILFFIKCQKKREMYSCYFVVKKSIECYTVPQFFFANIYLI